MAIAYFCDHCGAEIAPGDTICPVCQQPLASSATFQASGDLLNERYALISEVGAGGFGAVYKARDAQEHDRLVAVKQINLQGLSSQEIIEATDAFNREAEILTTLNHPLLPTIFDRFSDPEHWYLVMTYIDGTTLDEYLQQHRVSGSAISAGLPLGETLEIALRLCGALHYLHSQQPPVIFRDLKPGNIMRTRKGQLYLIDFGIARRFKPGQAKDTIPFGSPGFAAPEQYGRAQTTPQADIYSLGALLYCLITGDDPSEHPFDFPSLHHYAITGTRELNALIQRMVSPDPISRPANIQVVQAEFRRIQDINTKANQQGRIWTPPQGQTPPANGSSQQHIFLNPTIARQQQARKTTRRAVITTALILGGVAAFGGIAALASQTHHGVNGGIPQPLVNDQNQGGPDYQATDIAQGNAEATATATQTPTVFQNGTPFWSPDLSYAAMLNASSGQIELYKTQGQQLIRTIKAPDDLATSWGVSSIWWSPDNSKILVQVYSTGMIYSWNTANSQQIFTFTAAIAGYSFSDSTNVTWSPDGQICTISYHEQSNNTNLVFLNTNNGQQLFHLQVPYNVVWSPDSRSFVLLDYTKQWSSGQLWSEDIWERGTFQKIGSIGGVLPSASSDEQGEPYSDSVLTAAWLPDGKHLIIVFENSNWKLDIFVNQSGFIKPTATFFNVTSDADGSVSSCSPDGKYLAIFDGYRLSILNTLKGQEVTLNSNFPQIITAFAWSSDSQSITVVDSNANISHWPVG